MCFVSIISINIVPDNPILFRSSLNGHSALNSHRKTIFARLKNNLWHLNLFENGRFCRRTIENENENESELNQKQATTK